MHGENVCTLDKEWAWAVVVEQLLTHPGNLRYLKPWKTQ